MNEWKRNKNGITLIALVVTIIVLLVLAAVAINLTIGENGIFTRAQSATEEYVHGAVKDALAMKQGEYEIDRANGKNKTLIEYLKSDDGNNVLNDNNELNLMNLLGSKQKIGNGTNKQDVYMVESTDGENYFLRYYDEKGVSRDLIEFQTSGDNTGNIDWDEIFKTAEKHPDQSEENNDIGIGTDGKPVNMDLWTSVKVEDGYDLQGENESGYSTPSYKGEFTESGEIEGKVPQYIKKENDDRFYPVIEMYSTFVGCTSLVTAPEIPSSVIHMESTFADCTSLTTAPEIPSSVTDMGGTFSGCTSLATAPEIPSGVTNISYTFRGCTRLTTAPEIPSGVTDMGSTFADCTSLVTAPEIPNNVTDMQTAFSDCTSLTTVPKIPSSVTDMRGTFSGCTSLVTAPEIQNGVERMNSTFEGCINLSTVPEIPSSVSSMESTFEDCTNLTGTLVINASPSIYSLDDCFLNAATSDSANLILTGESTMLDEFAATADSNSHITVQK